MKLEVKDLCVIAILSAIIFSLEQVLSFLPNIQLTIFLLVLYSKKLGLYKTSLIVVIHTILDNLIMGSFNIMFFPFMLLGWMIIPICLNTIFKKVESNISLAFLSVIFAITYASAFIIPNMIFLHIDIIPYITADLPFTGLLAASSFLSVLWLYNPCKKILDTILGE